MLSSSNRLRYIVSFLEGTAFSLRYEVINLVLICMYIIYLLEYQFRNAQNLRSHQLNDEFAALSRYNKGEKDVPIKEIKDAVMKAIQVLLIESDQVMIVCWQRIYLLHITNLVSRKGIMEVNCCDMKIKNRSKKLMYCFRKITKSRLYYNIIC
jgi:hypothetical protein